MRPKIRWCAKKDEYGHMITAEISLGGWLIQRTRYHPLLGAFSGSGECACLHNRKNTEEYGGRVE